MIIAKLKVPKIKINQVNIFPKGGGARFPLDIWD